MILLFVLAGAAVVGVAGFLMFRKYRRSRSQQQPPPRVPKRETKDAENPSASREVVANSSRTSSSLDSNDDDNETASKRNNLSLAFDQAFQLLQSLLEGKSLEDFKSVSALKKFLRDMVEDVLLEEPHLRERKNGPALFLRMGMDKPLVEKRFSALMQFEKELGIVGKLSFVDTIDSIIENIASTNPFGEVNDTIQDLDQNSSLLGVRLKKGYIISAIDKVAREIQRKGWANLFMHGTTAALAKAIYEDRAQLDPALGKHDLGKGVYCFRGNRSELFQALSFAANRTFATGKNPCIIAFPEPVRDIDRRIINANRETIIMRKVRAAITPARYNALVAARANWTEDTKHWKTALYLTRTVKREIFLFYKDCELRSILTGWLHDSDSAAIAATDAGNADPQIDEDEWMQYCVSDLDFLGEKKLYIEFHVNKWEEWSTQEDVDTDIVVAWREYAASVARAR